MKKLILASLLVLGMAFPGYSYELNSGEFYKNPYHDSSLEPHPTPAKPVYDGFPIGTMFSVSQKMSDPEKKGYLLCDGRSFDASKYPTLAKALMTCMNCGNSLNGSTYCKYCKKNVEWKYAYNSDSSPRSAPKVPDMSGKFLRGFNRGTGFVSEGDEAYGLYSMTSGNYRSNHLSGKMGEEQESAAKGNAVSGSGDGNISFLTLAPLNEDGNSLVYYTDTMNANGNATADMTATEYIQSTTLTKGGNILRIISTFGFWEIPGLFKKKKTYVIGTPVRYQINADINTDGDYTSEYARPVNMGMYYYIRCW